MRILHVHTDLLGGGIEAMITTLALATRSAEVGICWCPANHPEPPPEYVTDLERKGIKLFRIAPPFLSPQYPFRLARTIRRFRPDVLHLHGSTVGVIGAIIGRLLRVRAVVYTEHVRHALLPGWLRRARELTARLPHWTVFVSWHMRDEAVDKTGSLRSIANCSSVVHNGVDLSSYLEPEAALQNTTGLHTSSECPPWTETKVRQRDQVRAELGVPRGGIAIGCVGLLWFAKGQEFLVRSLPLVDDRLASRLGVYNAIAHLLLVGSGEDELKLRELSRELEVAERVHFVGWRSDVPRILRALDVYVQPSLSEGLPLSLIEASAAGLPIVATRVGGVPEVVRDGIEGLLVPPGDAGALADAIVELLCNTGQAQQLAASAKRRAFELFSADAMARAYKKLYQNLLAGSSKK